MTSFGEKLLLVDDTTDTSLLSKEFVLMVSLGSGGSGMGLIVSLTPSELVSTGPDVIPEPLELGVALGGSCIALMCSFGIAGGAEDAESSSLASRLLWCEW